MEGQRSVKPGPLAQVARQPPCEQASPVAQGALQAPQWATSLWMSTHEPLQEVTQPVPQAPAVQVARSTPPSGGAAQAVHAVPQPETLPEGTQVPAQSCQLELQA